MRVMNKEHLLALVLKQIPRLLSLMDRNISFATHGCFDRQYWHYRTVDFPAARYQEACLTLTLLYKLRAEQNPYYHSKLMKQWIQAGVQFWTIIQETNGSFNEWYPRENSFVATAFSTAAISEVLFALPELRNYQMINAIKKAAEWLLKHDETRVWNQEAGAALALYNTYLLTNEQKYRKGALHKIELLLKHQNEEGWWMEYEGPDIGYLSLTIDYLAKYYQKSKDRQVLPALRKAVSFISYFVHPDGSAGGVYGSRNTHYLIPSGFFILNGIITEAVPICKAITDALARGTSVELRTFDDRYLVYIGYTWLQAYENFKLGNGHLPWQQASFSMHFKHAGIVVWNTEDYYIIVNARKGGAFYIWFKKQKKQIMESGVIQKTSDGYFSSGRIHPAHKCTITANRIKIMSHFYPLSSYTATPFTYGALRFFQATFGRLGLSKMLKKKLRDVLISKQDKSMLIHNRVITHMNTTIVIKDIIQLHPKATAVLLDQQVSELYVPSSQYFREAELHQNSFTIPVQKGQKQITLQRTFSKDGSVLRF